MADKYKVNCKKCNRERYVSRASVYLINKKIGKGMCPSCAATGRHTFKGKPYDISLYNSPLYNTWSNMKRRCKNLNDKNYGGRGITMDSKWETFAGFLEDMQSSYRIGLTIDRIDNNKGYSKKNCRWATKTEQANNRRTNTRLSLMGETKTFAEWCKLSNEKPSTIRQRYYAYGWSLKNSLSF